MRIIETKVYTIDEHPDKSKCFNWIRDNWHDLNQHSVGEVIASINSLSEQIGGTVSYSISQVPDIGEHITFKDYSHEDLCFLSADDCPLTGCWSDVDIIVGLRHGTPEDVLKSLHTDTEYTYSDAGLFELCMSNDYEFNEKGEFIPSESD